MNLDGCLIGVQVRDDQMFFRQIRFISKPEHLFVSSKFESEQCHAVNEPPKNYLKISSLFSEFEIKTKFETVQDQESVDRTTVKEIFVFNQFEDHTIRRVQFLVGDRISEDYLRNETNGNGDRWRVPLNECITQIEINVSLNVVTFMRFITNEGSISNEFGSRLDNIPGRLRITDLKGCLVGVEGSVVKEIYQVRFISNPEILKNID
jgi:hypothetical protein